MPSIFNVWIPKARVRHICCECESTINPGEKYEKCSGLWDDFATYKTCLFCAGVRDDARNTFDLNSDEGFPFGELWECVGFDYAAST